MGGEKDEVGAKKKKEEEKKKKKLTYTTSIPAEAVTSMSC